MDIKKYFEENVLKGTCFDTLKELKEDRTLVQINAPRALIAVELLGVWRGLYLMDKEQKSHLKEQMDNCEVRITLSDAYFYLCRDAKDPKQKCDKCKFLIKEG